MYTAILLALLFGQHAPVAPHAPVRVYVTSEMAGTGLSDPNKDIRDTIKDLQEAVLDRKTFALAESREDASIVLVVLPRETEGMTANWAGTGRDRVVKVGFESGDVKTTMQASVMSGSMGSAGAWGKAAKKLVKQIDEWVTANRGRLEQPVEPKR